MVLSIKLQQILVFKQTKIENKVDITIHAVTIAILAFTFFISGSGNSVAMAIEVLKQHGVKVADVLLVSLFCTPFGNYQSICPLIQVH